MIQMNDENVRNELEKHENFKFSAMDLKEQNKWKSTNTSF